MKKIYVAGPYSADSVIQVLQNIGRGQAACANVFAAGMAPFCPWHDRSYIMDMPDAHFKVDQFQEHSMVWLEVSDAVYLVSGWESSEGTLAEIDRAKDLGLPVFESFAELLVWNIKQKGDQK